jgi:hypothetical protein
VRRSLALLLCCLGLAPTIVSAQTLAVPWPANSTLPACMALCPLGDLPFTVVVRDLGSNPIPGSTVVLDFSLCPGAQICGGESFDPYIVDLPTRTIRAVTDVTGLVVFPARIGGIGPVGSVRVYADGVPMRTYALASPDQDGDGLVLEGLGSHDTTVLAPKLGTNDLTADFDCDGDVDEDDEIVFYYHYSQSCFGGVDPVKRGTWGELKSHYR